MSTRRHVVEGLRGEWRVLDAASQRGRIFASRQEALAFARDAAKREGGDVIVHNDDGTVRDLKTYERRAG